MNLDTHKFIRTLTDGGISEAQAEAIAKGLREADLSEAATRADLAVLRADVKADLAAIKADFTALRADVNADFTALRADVKADAIAMRAEVKADFATMRAEVKADFAELYRYLNTLTLRLIVATVGLTTGLTVTLIKLLP
jgi:hypothetical protein